jgi:hypothetical protein
MRWRDFKTLIYFVIAAVIFGAVCWVILSPDVMWFAPVVSLVLISIGLGFSILVLIRHTDSKIEAITITLENIKQIQEAIQKNQKEQSSSSSTIVPTLQAFSQLYLDYLTKQQSGEEQQNNIKDD